jgi:hypothetical protein
MSEEQATIGQLMAEVAEMRREITSLKSALSAATAENDNPALTGQADKSVATSRRRMLKKLGAGAMLTGLVATAGLASQTQTAHAEVLNNPFSNIGAIITPKGSTVSGTPPSSRKFGLLASANAALDLSTLTGGPAMAAIFGQGKGGLAGVLGTSDTNIGVFARSSSNDGLHALSDTGRGVVGSSNTATAVTGDSNAGIGVFGDSTSSVGVFGASSRDVGVKATSITGAPFEIVPQDIAPTTNLRKGQMYVDMEGTLFVYTSSGWRPVIYNMD